MEDLSLHILDIVQNSIAASAKNIEIEIIDDRRDNILSIRVADDGSGMDEDVLKKVEDPFYSSKGKETGLGIPLLKQSAIECEGEFRIDSTPERGTTVLALFRRDHIDRKPLGDIASTLVSSIISCPDCHFRLIGRTITEEGYERAFIFDTEEIKRELGEIPINSPGVLKFIKEYTEQSLKGVLFFENQ